MLSSQRQNERYWAIGMLVARTNVTRVVMLFGCPRVTVHNTVRQYNQTENTIDLQGRDDLRQRRRDRALKLLSRICASGSIRQLYFQMPQRFNQYDKKHDSKHIIFMCDFGFCPLSQLRHYVSKTGHCICVSVTSAY